MFWRDGKASETAGRPYPVNTEPSTSGRCPAYFCQSDIRIDVTPRSRNASIGQPLQRDTGVLRFAAMSITANNGRGRRKKTGKQGPASILIDVQEHDGQDDVSAAVGSRQSKRKQWIVRLDDAVDYAKHLAAGALSSVVCRTALAPLERLKLEMVLHRRQGMRRLAREIATTEGLLGFWKGNAINCLRTAPHKSINFFSFDCYRKALLHMTGNTEFGGVERFAAGAMAGMTATSLCFPLDVLRTRVMAAGGKPGNVVDTLRHILATEGPRALYVGIWPAVISMAPSGAVFYGVYDVLKEAYIRTHKVQNAVGRSGLDAQHTLLFGAIAGATSEFVVYPMEVIRRRMQLLSMAAAGAEMSAGSSAARYGTRSAAATGMTGFRIAAAQIMKSEGVRGLYAGIWPTVLQVLPNAALSYYAYEYFKALLDVKA